jgi:hypothetical protein
VSTVVFLACIQLELVDAHILPCRCLSPRGNLDEDSLCRCQEHTEALVNRTAPGVLWDEYGIVGALVVSFML